MFSWRSLRALREKIKGLNLAESAEDAKGERLAIKELNRLGATGVL